MQDFWVILVAMFIVVDPIGLVPLFISVTSGLDETEKKRAIRTSVIVSLAVLSLFVLVGRYILSFLGISPGAFFIAGGIMLFISAIDSLMGAPRRAKSSELDAHGLDAAQSIAIFPLAIPLISGPGAITTIMIYSSIAAEPLSMGLILFACAIITVALCFCAMRLSGLILKALGRTGVSVLGRVMGLILAGLAVQFVYEGLVKLHIVA